MTNNWTTAEKEIIRNGIAPLRIFSVFNDNENLILRKECDELSAEQLQSEEFQMLAQKLLASVDYPGTAGVGVAAPQVGISKRVVALQRPDKKGKPFEVYANIRIIAYRGEKKSGREGCLSVPGKRGFVERYRDIDIQYTDLNTLETKTERVRGFASVIVQHECDHLDGILYIDKCDELLDFE